MRIIMNVYVVLDDNNGMMFNYRRQSKDILLIEDILNDSKEGTLWISKYSAEQFCDDFPEGLPSNLKVDDEFFRKAGDEDNCFVEEYDLSFHLDKIKKLVIYRWNRRYPADFYFALDLSDGTWKRTLVSDIKGNSHEKITKEVWIRESH